MIAKLRKKMMLGWFIRESKEHMGYGKKTNKLLFWYLLPGAYIIFLIRRGRAK